MKAYFGLSVWVVVVAMLFLQGIAATPVFAGVTYYVSSTLGNDASDGQSPERAWQQLSKIYLKSVSSVPFQPGDQILLKRGDQWHGQIRLRANGANGNPIILGSYGQGPKPLLLGEVLANWQPVFGHFGIYSWDLGPGSILGAILQDEKNLRAIFPPGSLNQNKEKDLFFSTLQPGAVAGELDGRLWLRMADGHAPTGNVRVFRYAGLSLSDSAYMRIENLDIEHFSTGIDVEASRNIVIAHNDIRQVLGIGIYLRSGDSDCQVESNTVSHSGNTALYVLKGTRNIFRDNWVSHVDNSILGITTNGDHMGIGLQESQETLVEYNYLTYSGGIDFYFERGSTVRHNYLTRVTSAGAPHGVDLKVYANLYDLGGQGRSTGVNAVTTGPGTIAVFNNTILNASRFFLMGSSNKGGRVEFSNNIAASTIAGISMTAFGPGVASDHNCFFEPGTPVFTYATTTLQTFAAYQQQSGLDKNSVVADPQFFSPAPTTPLDLRIRAGSKCDSPATVPESDRPYTYDHDATIPDKPVMGAFAANALPAWSENVQQSCKSRCRGHRFIVSSGVYLVRIAFSSTSLSETLEPALILNSTKVVAKTGTTQEASRDSVRQFLVRPEDNSIVLDLEPGADESAISQIDIFPFDSSHGDGLQIISW